MKTLKIIQQLSIGLLATLVVVSAGAQVTSKGISPAYNTLNSFVDGSIVRDSGIDQPLDLLNDFYPAIEITISDHDNVRRRADIQEDDMKVIVAPSLAYRTNIGRHQFYVAYSGRFAYHDELNQEDSQSNSLVSHLGLDIARRWDLNVFAGIGNSFEERGISGSRAFNQFIPGLDAGPDEIDYYQYGADLIYGRKVSPLNAVLGFEKHTSKFTNNFQGDENIIGGRDRDIDSIHFDISYQIGSKTSIFGRVQKSDVDYDRAFNSLDSEQTDYLLGVRWRPSNALSGVIGVGSSDKDFIDPTRSDYSGDNYYVNLDYMLNPFSVVSLSASRAVEEPGDDLSDYYESSLLGIAWDHGLTSQLGFNVYAKRVDDEYNTGRDDEFIDFGLSLDYAWKPWLTAGIYYGQIERDSTLDELDYDDSYFGIRLRSDLRPLLKGRRNVEEPDSFEYPQASNK